MCTILTIRVKNIYLLSIDSKYVYNLSIFFESYFLPYKQTAEAEGTYLLFII